MSDDFFLCGLCGKDVKVNNLSLIWNKFKAVQMGSFLCSWRFVAWEKRSETDSVVVFGPLIPVAV